MKEIKFRAWDKKEKKMREPFGLESVGDTFVFTESTGFSAQYDPIYKRRDVEIMQFTGLKDRNGKEIYEGDLIHNKWTSVYGIDIGSIWEVKFGEYDNSDVEYGSGGHIGFFVESLNEKRQEGLHNLPTDDFSHLPEVVGNIYETNDDENKS